MKILDLFAGLRGWSDPFRERGHETFTVDIDSRFQVDSYKDVSTLTLADLPWRPDIILASPPCEGFSVMQIGKNWHGSGCKPDCIDCVEHTPKTNKARLSQRLVESTVALIRELQPKFWVIENPRAKLRKLPMMEGFDRHTVTYCKYGETRMKPTDLWGGFPPSFSIEAACKNGDSCHVSAPRGSRTGTQGMDRAVSAKIPRMLALSFCLAAENDFVKTVAGEDSRG